MGGRKDVRWSTSRKQDLLQSKSVPTSQMHQHIFDVKLAGDEKGRPQPQMCDDDAGCKHLSHDFGAFWAPGVGPVEENSYKCARR